MRQFFRGGCEKLTHYSVANLSENRIFMSFLLKKLVRCEINPCNFNNVNVNVLRKSRNLRIPYLPFRDAIY